MRIRASAISHPGNCREKNEDNFCFHGILLEGDQTPRPCKLLKWTAKPLFFGIFDGMGGIKAGERASRIAAETAREALQTGDPQKDPADFLANICTEANSRACTEMQQVLHQRMGTTASMLLFHKDRYQLCNIGDSPIFLFRDGQLTPIFHEHTEKENFLLLHGPDAPLPQKKFKLTQNIGIFPEEMEIEPFLTEDTCRPGDRFLICSDGLSDMVDEAHIAQLLAQNLSPAKTVTRLLAQALENGGKDNTTIICIDIK